MTDPDKAKIALRYWLLGAGYHRAIEAMEFAGKLHTGFRKDGITPEFHHQVCIAQHIRTLKNLDDEEDSTRFEEPCIAVAFLHDTIEDYDVSNKELELLFGRAIASAVETLSKIVDGKKRSNEDYYRNIADNPFAAIVKGCDRIHNLSSIAGVFTIEKQKAYIVETKQFVLPMLKEARRKFPHLEPAFENIKLVLTTQVQLLEYALNYINLENAGLY